MKYSKLENIVNILSGYAFKSKHFNSDAVGLPLIRCRDINTGLSGTYYSGEYDNQYLIKNGDILVSMDGDFKVIKWSEGKALLNQRVCRIIPDETRINSDYLLHFLPKYLERIQRKTSFSTVKHLSAKKIYNIKIPLPSLNDQRKIASLLSRIGDLIDKRKQSLLMLGELLESAFLYMFGDDTKVKGKQCSINELKVNQKGTFSNGPFGSDLLTSELMNSGVPVIYIRDIRDERYEWISNVYVTEEKANYLSNCVVHPNDVLIAKVGDPPGVAAVYPQNASRAIITQDVIRIRLNEDIVLPMYFKYYLNSVIGKRLISKITIKGTRSRFPLGQFKKLKINIPEIKQQEKFVQIANKCELLKIKYESSLAELENLFGSASQRAFKGELDLSKIPIDNQYQVEELIRQGELFKTNNQLDKAVQAFQKSLDLTKQMEDDRKRAIALLGLSDSQKMMQQYQQAAKNLMESADISKRIKEINLEISSLSKLGEVQRLMNQHSQALKTLQRTAEIAQKMADMKSVAEITRQISKVYESQNHYSNAIKAIQRSIDISKQIKDMQNAASSLAELGNIHKAMKQFNAAENAIRESNKLFKQLGATKTVEAKGPSPDAKENGEIPEDSRFKTLVAFLKSIIQKDLEETFTFKALWSEANNPNRAVVAPTFDEIKQVVTFFLEGEKPLLTQQCMVNATSHGDEHQIVFKVN